MNRLVVVFAAFVLIMACTPPTTPSRPGQQLPPAQRVSPEVAEEARQAFVDWLECEECEEGQLRALVSFGELLVPSLRATLIEGPAPATVELLRRDLERRYDELLRYAETHPHAKPASTKVEFVDLYLGKLDAQYRVRAAQGLGAIRGERAITALQEGRNATRSPVVRKAIEDALAGRKPPIAEP